MNPSPALLPPPLTDCQWPVDRSCSATCVPIRGRQCVVQADGNCDLEAENVANMVQSLLALSCVSSESIAPHVCRLRAHTVINECCCGRCVRSETSIEHALTKERRVLSMRTGWGVLGTPVYASDSNSKSTPENTCVPCILRKSGMSIVQGSEEQGQVRHLDL